MNDELWEKVDGFNYEVSSYGRLRNFRTKEIKYVSNSSRYLHFGNISIHREVAKHFLSPVKGKNYVNHRDGNKHNNNVDNLEWCTQKENIEHAIRTGLVNNQTHLERSRKAKLRTGKKNSCWRGYVAICKNDNIVTIVETLKCAEKWIRENTNYKNADKGNISLVCNGKLKQMY